MDRAAQIEFALFGLTRRFRMVVTEYEGRWSIKAGERMPVAIDGARHSPKSPLRAFLPRSEGAGHQAWHVQGFGESETTGWRQAGDPGDGRVRQLFAVKKKKGRKIPASGQHYAALPE
jgi:hypothetical protein